MKSIILCRRAVDEESIVLTTETAGSAVPCVQVFGPDKEQLARLFVQAPHAHKLLQEAQALLSPGREHDLYAKISWLAQVTDYLATVKGAE